MLRYRRKNQPKKKKTIAIVAIVFAQSKSPSVNPKKWRRGVS